MQIEHKSGHSIVNRNPDIVNTNPDTGQKSGHGTYGRTWDTNPDMFGHPDILAVGRILALKIERGYNQRCQWYQNLPLYMPEPHAKFHQNWWSGF